MSIEAWDVVAKKKVKMIPSSIKAFKYATKKEGGYRYRLAGRSKDGHNLSLFVKKSVAEKHGPVKLAKAKERKSCKQIGKDAEDRCEGHKATRASKAAAGRKAGAAKRAAARKAKKKKAPKPPAARKPRRKKK